MFTTKLNVIFTFVVVCSEGLLSVYIEEILVYVCKFNFELMQIVLTFLMQYLHFVRKTFLTTFINNVTIFLNSFTATYTFSTLIL
jgi:hypothetical protein